MENDTTPREDIACPTCGNTRVFHWVLEDPKTVVPRCAICTPTDVQPQYDIKYKMNFEGPVHPITDEPVWHVLSPMFEGKEDDPLSQLWDGMAELCAQHAHIMDLLQIFGSDCQALQDDLAQLMADREDAKAQENEHGT